MRVKDVTSGAVPTMREEAAFKAMLDEYGRLSRVCGAALSRPAPLIFWRKRWRLEREFQAAWKAAAEQWGRVFEAYCGELRKQKRKGQ
tara:strand:+ start:365 stop:628 length:264 start_codon:yes stop_codon:yes gene_type:complete